MGDGYLVSADSSCGRFVGDGQRQPSKQWTLTFYGEKLNVCACLASPRTRWKTGDPALKANACHRDVGETVASTHQQGKCIEYVTSDQNVGSSSLSGCKSLFRKHLSLLNNSIFWRKFREFTQFLPTFPVFDAQTAGSNFARTMKKRLKTQSPQKPPKNRSYQ
jgi:hypothetical protein